MVQEVLTTRPVLIQVVQTTIFWGRPSRSARTFCKLGLKRRFVTLWAWLTLQPTIGFFPHISQTLAICILQNSKFGYSASNAASCAINESGFIPLF